ncbi:MAG: response regulator [Anaerolineales bacterium]|jgi:CheY-like chemotaxis protein
MPNLLLVEDDRDMVTLLRTLLEMEGYTVGSARSGDAVLAMVDQQRPDIVLLDVNLAGQSGLQVLQTLRSRAETRAIRVIMTSGMDLSEQCLQEGADAFLLKPYMPDELVRLLEEVLAHSPPSSA